eukprot:GCRY01001425.1.p1 GENE.GCRY01001425.1~~GCRY01001425.1.p1  ORF type:complete len:271 (+),score=24.30 GCRY01001425.1:203-1015(+)
MASSNKHDINKRSWEEAEFPIACEVCLGPNQYVRMMKYPYDKECHVCAKPYTMFRWKPGGRGMRYKQTVICQNCAKMKNICQVCMFDLKYGLPTGVIDHELGVAASEMPRSEVSRSFLSQQAENKPSQYQGIKPTENMLRLTRSQPYYERNRAKICTFFIRGECKRGKECPYRHEMPPDDKPLNDQKYRERYYGVDDPVASKMLGQIKEWNAAKEASQGQTAVKHGYVEPAVEAAPADDQAGKNIQARIAASSAPYYPSADPRQYGGKRE